MKKVFLTLFLAGSLLSANAENALTGTKFTDNWSVGFNAGVTQPLSHPYSLGENIRPQLGVELYKQFTPVFKTGLEFNAGINTTGIHGQRGVRTAFDHANLNLLGGLNLMNLFGGYKGEPRLFEIEAIGGIGVGHVFGYKATDGDAAHKNYMTSKFGLNLGFNLGKVKQFTLALKPAIIYNIDGRLGARSTGNNAVAYNSNKANFELMAGLSYHFKTSNGTHHFTYARLYDQNEIDGLNDKINSMRGELDGKDADLRAANQKINDLNDEVNRLKNRKPNEVRVVETVTQQTRSMESVVTFRQGKSTVDNAQLPNVERVATYLNNHKNSTVIIRGFASPEGSQEVNERIAKARAEAVKDILVKRYRISADRIDAQGNGVGDMFSEPDWNRVSICTIDDKDNK